MSRSFSDQLLRLTRAVCACFVLLAVAAVVLPPVPSAETREQVVRLAAAAVLTVLAIPVLTAYLREETKS